MKSLKRQIGRSLAIACVLGTVCAVSLPGGTAMKLTAVRIGVPESGQTVQLKGLEYIATSRNTFSVVVKDVRFDQTSDPGADPVKGTWTFNAVNGEGKVHRIDISVVLEDAKHKRMASYNAFMLVLAGSEGQELEIPMKVKAKRWAETKSILIQANFTS